MIIVAAECSATYSGRGDTKLPRAVRAIIIKADGSVSIHNDVSNKPLNYMRGAELVESTNEAGETLWVFDARQENLTITLHRIIERFETPLIGTDDPGLVRDGTESHLQEWIAQNPESLGAGVTLVSREFRTDNGPVDLLLRDADGAPLAVEVKRVAMLGAVYQAKRYVDALNNCDDETLHGARGIIAALDVRPKTRDLAEKRGIEVIDLSEQYRLSRSGSQSLADEENQHDR